MASGFPHRQLISKPRAHIYILALLAATVAAFWRGYFSRMSSAAFGLHLHAFTATLWMLLLAVQAWSAHARRTSIHKVAGRASLFLFPALLAGMIAVLISMNRKTVEGDPLYLIYGARISAISVVAFAAIAVLYVSSLRYRTNVRLHANSALATPLLLLFSVMDRLVGRLPFQGVAGLGGFTWCVRIANAISLCIALLLYLRNRHHGRPFLITAAVISAQMVLWETVGTPAELGGLVRSVAGLPQVPVLMLSVLTGAGLSSVGWSTRTRLGIGRK